MAIDIKFRELEPSMTPSTLHRFQTKTILFCSGYGYRPHYNGPKTDRFENALQSGTI